MKTLALGVLSAVALGAALIGTAAPAHANGYGYDDYDGSTTVITRRTIIERRVIRPRPVVRDVVVERPVVYRPRPVYREEFVERDGYDGPRSFHREPDRFGYGRPGYGPYDD